MYWKKKTCKICIFRSDMECRKNPPSVASGFIHALDHFPRVVKSPEGIVIYNNACSHYDEKI